MAENNDTTRYSSREEWLKIALPRYDERAGKVRDAYFRRWGSGSKAEKQHDEFLSRLNTLLESELFQKIKHRYVSSPKASNEAALISLLSADCCVGSLEFLLCETLDEAPSPSDYVDK